MEKTKKYSAPSDSQESPRVLSSLEEKIKKRIHRILYSFNIRRIFIPVKRFVRKEEKLTPELIKLYIVSMFKATVQKDIKAKKEAKAAEFKTPLLRSLMISVIAIFVILILLSLGLHFLGPEKPPVSTPEVGVLPEEVILPPEPKITSFVGDSGFLDSGGNLRWYVVLDLKITNVTTASLSFITYNDPIPDEIFILRSKRLFASNYNDFEESLVYKLSKSGLHISEITMDELLTIPEDSKITLLVPSGYIPALFLGLDDPNFDMKKFASRGNVLIYMGYPPTDGVLKEGVEGVQKISSSEISNKFGIGFDMEATEKPARFSYQNSLYSVRPSYTGEERPNIIQQPGEFSVSWGGGGYVYFIPITLDDWWGYSCKRVAEDISDAISKAYWEISYQQSLPISLKAEEKIDETTNKTIEVIEPLKKIIFTREISKPELTTAFGRIIINAENRLSEDENIKDENLTSFSGKVIYVSFPQRPNGRLRHSNEVLSSALTGKILDMEYTLNEGPTLDHVYLKIFDQGNNEIYSTLISPEQISLQVSKATYRFNNFLESGEYITKLTNSVGKILAQSYLRVPKFKMESYTPDWGQGLFTFNVYIKRLGKGEDVWEAYIDKLTGIEVSIDGRDPKSVDIEKGKLKYITTEMLTEGEHIFSFKIGADRIDTKVIYEREKSMFEQPLYLGAIIFTIAIVAIGYFFRPKEKTMYFVDVPDFPPLRAIAIPVKKQSVIDLFEKINKELRWEYTPLSLSDLKAGFKKITHRGSSILIGTYNLEMILDQLINEGYVKNALDYYGLTSWERKTDKSIHYLAMERALRDLFVNEGIPFIPFGKRPECDTIITLASEKLFIYIYEDKRVISRAISTSSEGRSIIIFENDTAMREFTLRIHSPSSINVMFKMLLDNGQINVTPLSDLMNVLHKKFTFSAY